MPFKELPRQRDHIPRLAAKQPNRLYVVANPVLAQSQHFLRIIGNGEKRCRRAIDTLVGRLGRKYDRNEKGIVIDEMEFALRFGIGSLEPAEQFFYFGWFQMACFGHEDPVQLPQQR